jgi:hypothetical protein
MLNEMKQPRTQNKPVCSGYYVEKFGDNLTIYKKIKL